MGGFVLYALEFVFCFWIGNVCGSVGFPSDGRRAVVAEISVGD